jgi:glycerol-3-phosphate dehydrogenase (NAD(P)+)
LHATADLEEALAETDVLVVGVPSHGFRGVVEQARPWVRPWIPIVSLTKGLEVGSLLRMTQVLEELLPGHPAAALTGPNLAREILAGHAAASVIATEDLGVAAALQDVLRTGLFRIYRNHDVIGCEIGGALKNVIAIAAGIAQGLGVGDNTRAGVITRGLAELTRLGVAMGADARTLAGLAGMGDLVATAMSPYSRNRTVGEQLGLGRSLDDILRSMSMVAEGVKTASTVMELAKRYDLDLPICTTIYRVVQGEIPATEAYRGLRRTPGHEADPG